MRLRKADLKARVNADLVLRFQASGLTSYAGLELVRRYLRTIDLAGRMRRHLDGKVPGTDFGVVSMVLVLLTLMIAGGRRLRHLLYLGEDPVVLRLCGLRRLPTARTVGRWLSRFTCRHLSGLHKLNEELVAETIRRSGIKRLTIDVDGTVVSTGLKVERARRGYNPHHRKVPSYYPISAFEAQSGQLLRVRNRPGNVHDGKASLRFLGELFAQIRTSLGKGYLLEFRMDGAFFRRDVIELLDKGKAEYAIKVPFYQWLGLKARIQANRRWVRVSDGVDFFEKQLRLDAWDREMRVVVYRKKVNHRSAKNYQLDLFDPADGHWEYSAIVTNKDLTGRYLWHFLCGRGGHEKVYGELKSGFAFDCLPTMRYAANGVWQILSVMAFNLMRGFQVATTAQVRTSTRTRRSLYRFARIETMRYECLGRAGVVVSPGGKPTLDVGRSHGVRKRFEFMEKRLQKAA